MKKPTKNSDIDEFPLHRPSKSLGKGKKSEKPGGEVKNQPKKTIKYNLADSLFEDNKNDISDKPKVSSKAFKGKGKQEETWKPVVVSSFGDLPTEKPHVEQNKPEQQFLPKQKIIANKKAKSGNVVEVSVFETVVAPSQGKNQKKRGNANPLSAYEPSRTSTMDESTVTSNSTGTRRLGTTLIGRRNRLKILAETRNTMSTAEEKTIRSSDVKTKRFSLKVEGTCALIFFIAVGLALILAFAVQDASFFGDAAKLEVGVPQTGFLEVGGVFFYELPLEAGVTISVLCEVENTSELDPTLTLLSSGVRLLDFNDDIEADSNLNSLVFYTSPEKSVIYVEVGSFGDATGGNFSIVTNVINEDLKINEISVADVKANQAFITKIALEKGGTYHAFAFANTGNALNEVPTVIRIRDITGNEILQTFQTTLFEHSASAVFTSPRKEFFILEVRLISNEDIEVQILVQQTKPTPINLESFANDDTRVFENLQLKQVFSSVYEFKLEANENFRFDFDFAYEDVLTDEINRVSAFDRVLTPSEEISPQVFFTRGIVNAVSFRLYEKVSGKRILRGQSSFKEVNINQDDLISVEGVGSFPVVDFVLNETSFSFNPRRDFTALLEVGRMHPDFSVLLENGAFGFADDTKIANLTMTVSKGRELSKEEIEERQSIVDPNDLFETCEVDQTKFSSNEECDQGIVLFCYHEYFALADFKQAKRKNLVDACNCIDFLCVNLPSATIGKAFLVILDITYGLFASISGAVLLVYFFLVGRLIYFKAFKGFLKRGFQTWSISAFYFFLSAVFFITQISLTTRPKVLELIAKNFDETRIPLLAELESYTNYEEEAYALLNPGFVPIEEEVEVGDYLLLNEDSLAALPARTTFTGLRIVIMINQLTFVLMQACATISFLDISVVWIKSSFLTGLNKEKSKRQFNRAKLVIRTLQGLYFAFLLFFAILMIISNGEAYTIAPSVVGLLANVFVIVAFIFARVRLKRNFDAAAFAGTLNKESTKVWDTIRMISTIVIGANFAVIWGHLFLIINVQNQADLVDANNDRRFIVMFQFMHGAYVTGALAIFFYGLRSYKTYDNTLFEPNILSEDESKTTVQKFGRPGSFQISGFMQNGTNLTTEVEY